MEITYDSIKAFLATKPSELILPAGEHIITPPTGGMAIHPLADILIRGAGMYDTTLVIPDGSDGIYARGITVSRSDLTITRDKLLATQGRVREAGRAYAIVDIDPRLPTPLDIFTPGRTEAPGRDLRSFTDHRNPRIMQGVEQYNWDDVERIDTTLWRFKLKKARPDLPVGRLVAVKSKKTGTGGIYRFTECVVLDERVRYLRDARGVFHNCRATVRHCRIEREEPWHCFSSRAGGWQFSGGEFLCEDNYARGTLDDPIAAYDGARGIIRRNKIIDAWRGMNIVGASTELVTLDSNRLKRCDVHYYPEK